METLKIASISGISESIDFDFNIDFVFTEYLFSGFGHTFVSPTEKWVNLFVYHY